MSDSVPRWNSLLDGPMMGRIGDALASPVGVLVLIPLLVVGVGGFMAAVGQRSVEGSIDTLAEARFTDQTQQAVRHTRETLGQATPLLETWEGFLGEQGGWPAADATAAFLRVLMKERGGLSFVSFASPTGDLIGAYRDDAGELFLSERRLDDGGRCLLHDHRIPAAGPIELTRTDEDCGYDARSRPFFRQAIRVGGMTWTDPYVFYDSGLPGVTCSAPLHDADGNFRGVVAVDFNLNDLSDYIAELDTMPQGRIFAYTGDRVLIAMPGSGEGFARDRRGEGELLTPEALGEPGLTAYFAALPGLDQGDGGPLLFRYEHGGDTVMASVTPCPLAGDLTWYVGALAPRSAFMAPAVAHRQTAVRVAAVALAVALALAALFAVHLVRSRRAAALARAAARAARREVKELGSYRLVRKLGEGGMGEVWLAEHQLLARPAAVKLLHGNQLGDLPRKELRDRLADFEREAQATAALSSASTVRLFDFGVSRDGLLFYVMELLEGIDLDGIVRQFGPLNPARVIHLMRQVCSSLAEAHDKGLVHRDIKPSNVFCCVLGDEYDVAKVTDFGLVHVKEGQADGERSDTVAGTPAYMSPEHCMGQVDLDGRSDLYALGCVGYWLLTGRTVFDRTEPKDMMRQHVTARPTPPSEAAPLPVPPELDRAILRCLNKKPDRRFADARELRDALEAIPIPDEQRWDRARRRAWWVHYGETVRGLQSGEPTTSPTPIRLERGPTQLTSSTDFESITLDVQTVPKLDRDG